jgi:adenosylcobinamide-phosphate synthase
VAHDPGLHVWLPGAVAALALALAWVADAAFGEPRNAWHPVAWLGRALDRVGRPLPGLPPALALVAGALAWLALALPLVAAAAWVEARLLDAAAAGAWAAAAAALALALLLKPCFAWRMLRDEVQAVDAALARGPQAQDLAAARARLAGLVSRDTAALDADTLREAALQTLAENLNDSLVAPLLWWALAGLPGAVLYRVANTADAMWGYRGRWRWAGKWAARADDALGWLPARLTALLLAPALVLRRRPTLAREARLTPSPNGGWPMAALALTLHVRLRKPGVYALNAAAPAPGPGALPLATAHASRAAAVAFALALLAGALAPGGLLR